MPTTKGNPHPPPSFPRGPPGPMQTSRYEVQVSENLDATSKKLLDDITASIKASMSTACKERSLLIEKHEGLKRENLSLEESNQKLSEEVRSLKSQLAGSGRSVPQVDQALPHGMAERTHPAPAVSDSAASDFVLERSMTLHQAPVHSVTIHENGDHFATASWDATVRFYNFEEQRVVQTFGSEKVAGGSPGNPGEMAGLYSVAFAKTAPNILGCTSCDKNVYLWNCDTGQNVRVLEGHKDEVNGIDFHVQQQVMCTASDDKQVLIWDFMEGLQLRKLDKHTNAVYGATFLGKEHQYLVATCCFDKITRIFDIRRNNLVAEVKGHTDDVIGIDYCPKYQLLATGSDDGLVVIWDVKNGWKKHREINTREPMPGQPGLDANEVKRVRWSNSGRYIAAACSSQCVLVYDINNESAPPIKLGGHSDCVFDVSWGTCPRTGVNMLVSASHDHSCRYWKQVQR